MSANEFYTNHMTTVLCHVTTSFGHHVISFLQPTVQNSNGRFTTLVILIVSKFPSNQLYLKTFQLLFFIHLLKRLIRQPRVSSVLKLVLLCSRDASEPEIVSCGYSKASTVSVWALTRKNILEMDSQLTCRWAKSIAFDCLLCEKSWNVTSMTS